MGSFFSGFGINQALGALGSLFGGISANKNIDKQIAAQSAENQKNREYNLMLAKQQNQWNVDQWNRENAYNDPSAQLQRLRTAGLNPDLVYGSGSAANLSAPSPEMTSGAPSMPVDMSAYRNRKTIGDVIQDSAALMQAAASIDKTKADSKKAVEEATGQSLDNIEKEFRNTMKEIDASYYAHDRYVSSEILESQWHQNKEQLRLLQSEVVKMDAEAVQAAIDKEFKVLHKDAYFNHILTTYRVTDEELSRLKQMTSALIRSANAEAEYLEDNVNYMKRIHEQDLKFDDLLASLTGETGYAKLFGLVISRLLKSFLPDAPHISVRK